MVRIIHSCFLWTRNSVKINYHPWSGWVSFKKGQKPATSLSPEYLHTKYRLPYFHFNNERNNLSKKQSLALPLESFLFPPSKTVFSLCSFRTNSQPSLIQWKRLLTVIALASRIRSHGAIASETFPLLITDALICTGIFLAGSAWSWRRDGKKRMKQSWKNYFSDAHNNSKSSLPLLSTFSCRTEKALTTFPFLNVQQTWVKQHIDNCTLHNKTANCNRQEGGRANSKIFPLRQAQLTRSALIHRNLW